MKASARQLLWIAGLVALSTVLSLNAFAGCGKSCYDITCIPDEETIGCVERWGYCWEVPCFAAVDEDGCSAYQALDEAFAAFGDVTGAEALDRLRSDEALAAQVLPFLRVVGPDGEVHRGAEHRKAPATLLADHVTEDDAEPATADR